MFEHPRNSNHVLGFDTETSEFLESFNSSRMHHAWLITGNKGIGKATFAYTIAKFLLNNPPKGITKLSFDNNDTTARKIENLSHPDLLVLEADEENKKPTIKVEDTREIGKFLSLTAVESKYRVVIIDSIDAMNNNAANALLKLLEEPSANVIFLLICHKLGQILPTIRSRCRLTKVKPLSVELFGQILRIQKPHLNNFDIADLYDLSSGSVGISSIFLESEKMDLYRKTYEIVSNSNRSKKEILELATLAGLDDNWEIISFVIEKFFSDQLKNNAITDITSVEAYLNKIAMIRKTLADSTSFYLDKGHVITSILS